MQVFSTRKLTNEERATLKHPLLGPTINNLPGSIFRFLLLFLVMLAGWGTFVAIVASPNVQWPGWTESENLESLKQAFLIWLVVMIWGSIFAVPAYITLRSHVRRYRLDSVRAKDYKQNLVEIIRLTDTSFITVVDNNDNSLFLFDLDGNKTLIIGDDVEWCPELFGLPALDEYDDIDDENDDGEDYGPGSKPDIPFPNTDCLIHRLPNSGRILKIELRGEKQNPKAIFLSNELKIPLPFDFTGTEAYRTAILNQPLDNLAAV